MREVAYVGEGVDEFGARALAVGQQARDVAAVDAAPRREQVVARAPRDAAQLKLARRGRGVLARAGAGQRETGVALDALARGEQRVPPGFVNAAALRERVLDGAERVDGRALDALHLLLVGGGVRLSLGRARGRQAGAAEHEHERRQRPGQRQGRGLRDGACASRVARRQAEEVAHAEGRCRCEVNDGEFAKKHCGLPEGNGHASFRRARSCSVAAQDIARK